MREVRLRQPVAVALVCLGLVTATVHAAGAAPVPSATITSPTANQSVPSGSVTITGTATADAGVGKVRLSIRNRSSLQYWNGATWVNTLAWVEAALASPGAAVTGWSYHLAQPTVAPLNVTAVAVDTAGTADPPPRPYVNFAVGGPADSAAPDTTITLSKAPDGAVLQNGVPVEAWIAEGTATDDRGVRHVAVDVRDVETGLWCSTHCSTWSTEPGGLSTTYVAGTGSTTWAWRTYVLPAYPGTFEVHVTTYDTSNNADPAPAVATFTSTTSPPDIIAPSLSVLTPASNGAAFPVAPMVMRGVVADSTPVVAVRLALRVRETNLYWNGSAFVTGFRWLPATLSNPGSPRSEWTYAWTPPGPGQYNVTFVAEDVAGNLTPAPRPYRNLTVG